MLAGTWSVTARIDWNLVRITAPRLFRFDSAEPLGIFRYCTITVTMPFWPTCAFMSLESLCAGEAGASPSRICVFAAYDGIAKPASMTRPRMRWPQVAPTESGFRRLDICVVLSMLISLFGDCWKDVDCTAFPPVIQGQSSCHCGIRKRRVFNSLWLVVEKMDWDNLARRAGQ